MISMRWSFTAKSSLCMVHWRLSTAVVALRNTLREHPPVNNKGKSDAAWGFRCSKEQLTPLGHAGSSWVGEWNLLFNKPLLESTLLPKCWRSGTNRNPQLQYMSQRRAQSQRIFVRDHIRLYDSHIGRAKSTGCGCVCVCLCRGWAWICGASGAGYSRELPLISPLSVV